MQVDFMLIGAQKCGTTSLAEQIAAHPDVCFCKEKEPGFFNETADWRQQLDRYHALFAPEAGQLCGEASTMYTFLPEWTETHARLHAYNPDLKLIYMMRQPVNRILSHYTHNLVRGIVKEPPEAVVLSDATYINRSRYHVQIKPYIEQFGRDNVRLFLFEEYVADQIGTLQQIADFLRLSPAPFVEADTEPKHKSVGVSYLKYGPMRALAESATFQAVRTFIPASVRHPLKRKLSNQIDKKPEFSPALKQMLWRFVEDDVCHIEQLLGRRLDVWRRGYTL